MIRLTSPAAPGINVDSLIVPETAQTLPISNRDRQGLAPGTYTLTVKDTNASAVEKTIIVGLEPGSLLKDVVLKKSGAAWRVGRRFGCSGSTSRSRATRP